MSRREPLRPPRRAASAPRSPPGDGLESAALTAHGGKVLLLLSLANLQGSSCLPSSPSWAVSMLHPITAAVFPPGCCSGDEALPSASRGGCDVRNKMETQGSSTSPSRQSCSEGHLLRCAGILTPREAAAAQACPADPEYKPTRNRVKH